MNPITPGHSVAMGLSRHAHGLLQQHAAQPAVVCQHSLRKSLCRAASDCSASKSQGAGSRPSTSSHNSSPLQQQQQPARQVPAASNQNNALPMPRNTAAAATALAVAGAIAQVQCVQQELAAEQLQQPFLQTHMSAQDVRYSSRRMHSSRSLQDSTAGTAAAAAAAADTLRTARSITKVIMACSSRNELQDLYQQHAGQLNLIHISAMFKQLTRCADGCAGEAQHAQHALEQQQQQQQGSWNLQQQRWLFPSHLQQQQEPAQDDWLSGQPQQAQQQQHQQLAHWHLHQHQQQGHHRHQQQQQQQQPDLLQQLELHSLQLLSTVQLPPAGAVQILRSASPQLLHPPDLQHAIPFQQQQQSGVHSSGAGSSASAHQFAATAQAPIQPQQLSTICWSCASLGYQPSPAWWACYWAASTPLLHSYSPRELATAISASGKLQQAPPATWMSGFEAACIAGRMAEATPQELCMMLQGVAVLHLQLSSQWVAALQEAVLQQLDSLAPRDISQVLWGHARLSAQPPAPWLSQVLAAASAQVPHFSARDSAMLLWALAALGHVPEQRLVSGLLGGMFLSSMKLKAATPQDCAHICWALATFERLGRATRSSSSSTSSEDQEWQEQQQEERQQHATAVLSDQQLQSWFRLTWQITQAAVPSSSSSSSSSSETSKSQSRLRQSIPNSTARPQLQKQQKLSFVDAAQLLWSASQLPYNCWPDHDWLGHFWSQAGRDLDQAGAGRDPGQADAQSLTVTLWASLGMGHRPPGSFLMAVTPVLQRQLAELQPAAACQLLYVLAKLQHRPNPAFMEQLLTRLQLDSHQLQPRAFACVLWALGRLGYQPGVTWWATVLTHLQGLVSQLGQRELTNVLFGLVALGVCQSSSGSTDADSSSSSDLYRSSSSHGEPGMAEMSQQLRQALLQRAAELGVSSCSSEPVSSPTDLVTLPFKGAPAVRPAGAETADDGRQPPLQQLLVQLA